MRWLVWWFWLQWSEECRGYNCEGSSKSSRPLLARWWDLKFAPWRSLQALSPQQGFTVVKFCSSKHHKYSRIFKFKLHIPSSNDMWSSDWALVSKSLSFNGNCGCLSDRFGTLTGAVFRFGSGCQAVAAAAAAAAAVRLFRGRADFRRLVPCCFASVNLSWERHAASWCELKRGKRIMSCIVQMYYACHVTYVCHTMYVSRFVSWLSCITSLVSRIIK